MGWSPEQISGRLKLEGSEHTISHESIYRYIYRPKVRKEKLHRYLARAKARRGRRYFKRHRLPVANRRSIHDRPEGAENREEFGHWEGDLMQFRTQRGNLLTLCERMTRFLITASLKTKTASETGNVLRNIFRHLPELGKHTVTFDNGGEFAEYEKLTSETGVQAFFCEEAFADGGEDRKRVDGRGAGLDEGDVAHVLRERRPSEQARGRNRRKQRGGECSSGDHVGSPPFCVVPRLHRIRAARVYTERTVLLSVPIPEMSQTTVSPSLRKRGGSIA